MKLINDAVNPENFEIMTETELEEICNIPVFHQLELIEKVGELKGWCEAVEEENYGVYASEFAYTLNKAGATKTAEKLENAENAEEIIDEIVRCVYHNLQ